MIVADTNVLVALWFPGPLTAAATQLLAADPDWAAPPLWRSEYLNTLAGYMRLRGLPLARAIEAFGHARTTIGDREFVVQSELVLDLVSSSSCSAYDCEFIGLARELGVRLVTGDRQILHDFPGIAVRLGKHPPGAQTGKS